MRKLGSSWVARLLFAAILLGILSINIDFDEVIKTLNDVGMTSLGVIFTLYFLKRYILAYQMSLGLKPLGLRFSVFELFKIRLISNFYSLIIPGDLAAGGAAWYKLASRDGQGFEAGALVVYFRLIDTLTLLAMGFSLAWFDPLFAGMKLKLVIAGMFIGVIAMASPFYFPPVTRIAKRLVTFLLSLFPFPESVDKKLNTVWRVFEAFQDLTPLTVTYIIVLSAVSHVMGIVVFYLFASAVDINLSIVAIGWIRSLLIIVQMVPITIAGLGVREISLVVLLRNYSVPQAQALSYSLAIFSVTVIAGGVGGMFEGLELLLGPNREVDDASLTTEANST